MDMKNAGDVLIGRASSLIVLISSIVMIAFMVTGGCESGGHGGPSLTPHPTPGGATDFPPECINTFNVDLSCPATSLAGSTCLPYLCDIIDNSEEPPLIIDNLTVVFGDHCTDTDCFTLECQDISVIDANTATIIIDSVSGTPVGEDVEGNVFQGTPDGVIIIGGEEFALDCNGFITP